MSFLLPPSFKPIPALYYLCNYILRTPCIGTIALTVYIYSCLPANTASGWYVAIAIVTSLLSLFSALPATVGTPLAFSVSWFFIPDFNEVYLTFYIIVTLLALPVFFFHYLVVYRLYTGRYLVHPGTGRIYKNPQWDPRQYFD